MVVQQPVAQKIRLALGGRFCKAAINGGSPVVAASCWAKVWAESSAWAAWAQLRAKVRSEKLQKTASSTGSIVDAVTGEPLIGVAGVLHQGACICSSQRREILSGSGERRAMPVRSPPLANVRAWRPTLPPQPPATGPAARSPPGHRHAGPRQCCRRAGWAGEDLAAGQITQGCVAVLARGLFRSLAEGGGGHRPGPPPREWPTAHTPIGSAAKNHPPPLAGHGAHAPPAPARASAGRKRVARRWNRPRRCRPLPAAVAVRRRPALGRMQGSCE